jgi:hypothetical protein
VYRRLKTTAILDQQGCRAISAFSSHEADPQHISLIRRHRKTTLLPLRFLACFVVKVPHKQIEDCSSGTEECFEHEDQQGNEEKTEGSWCSRSLVSLCVFELGG